MSTTYLLVLMIATIAAVVASPAVARFSPATSPAIAMIHLKYSIGLKHCDDLDASRTNELAILVREILLNQPSACMRNDEIALYIYLDVVNMPSFWRERYDIRLLPVNRSDPKYLIEYDLSKILATSLFRAIGYERDPRGLHTFWVPNN